MLSCETIRNRLEEADRYMTDDPFSAIYALRDGSLVSGNYNGGVRCEDHNCMNAVIDTDYYDRQFWHDVFSETGVLMLIPETMQIAFPNWVVPTKEQWRVIETLVRSGYSVETEDTKGMCGC